MCNVTQHVLRFVSRLSKYKSKYKYINIFVKGTYIYIYKISMDFNLGIIMGNMVQHQQ